jgi:hypothetical protein
MKQTKIKTFRYPTIEQDFNNWMASNPHYRITHHSYHVNKSFDYTQVIYEIPDETEMNQLRLDGQLNS